MIRAWLTRHRRPLWQFSLLLGEKGCRLLLGVLVGILVARTLGPHDYGQLSVAMSLAFLVSPLARLGLDEILTRDIAREPARGAALVGTGIALRLAGSILLLAGSLGALPLGLWPEPLGMLLPILLLAFCVQSLDTPMAFLMAVDRAGSVAAARLSSLLAVTGWRLAGVLQQAGLAWFALAQLVEVSVQGLAALGLSRRAVPALPSPRVESGLARRLLRESRYLTPLCVVGELTQRADVLILALFVSSQEVGIYAFGMRFIEVLYTLPVLAGGLALPRLAKQAAPAALAALVVRLAIAAAIGFGLLALVAAGLGGPIVSYLGGEDFARSGLVMAIAVLGVPFTALGILRYYYLLTLGRMRMITVLAIVDASQTILLITLFSWQWGIVGAAWAHGASRGLSFAIGLLLVGELRRLPGDVARQAGRELVRALQRSSAKA